MMKINFTNIMAYIQGNIRYKLYYSRFRFLIRLHIREQIDLRIRFMDKECYENGSCKFCGCSTTALQMADKQCDKPCYPPIMNGKDWNMFIKGFIYYQDQLSNHWLYTPPLIDNVKRGRGESLCKLFRKVDDLTPNAQKRTFIYPQNTLV